MSDDMIGEIAELIGTIDEITEAHAEKCEGCKLVQELLSTWFSDEIQEGFEIKVLK